MMSRLWELIQEIISRILARDEKDHQVFDPDTIGKIKKGADAQSVVYNKKTYVNVQKQWLKTNGQPYKLEQARQLPGQHGCSDHCGALEEEKRDRIRAEKPEIR